LKITIRKYIPFFEVKSESISIVNELAFCFSVLKNDSILFSGLNKIQMIPFESVQNAINLELI